MQTVRRERAEQTRARIVRALIALHEEIGPKNTTIAAVAARAGVQRLTVYRHFPDEAAMLQACSGQWIAENPPPQATEWEDQRKPADRLGAALLAINRYYAANRGMLAKVSRDAEEVKPLAAIMGQFEAYFLGLADRLAAETAGGTPAEDLRAVCHHVVRFSTWQSLAAANLSEEEIARIEVLWVTTLARTRRVAEPSPTLTRSAAGG